MRVFLYEWVTGGGLVGEPGRLPDSLLQEGLAMAQAVASDLVRSPGYSVTMLGDLRVPQLAAAGGRVVPIDSRAEHDAQFERAVLESDATILIAPETDGVLVKVVVAAESLGARLASPGGAFVSVASNKQQTADILLAAGVPAPSGRMLEPDAPLPEDFRYPAVVKPLDGAGSQDTYVVASAHDRPPAYAFPRRIEPFHIGIAASIGFLTGCNEVVPLPACRQKLSPDGRLSYLGGSSPLEGPLARRAEAIGRRALEALPWTVGYVGIDLVLGSDPSGSEDIAIEVNPRLTTSFAGLRYLCTNGLAAAMVETALGRPRCPEFSDRTIEFDASGTVSFTDEGRQR